MGRKPWHASVQIAPFCSGEKRLELSEVHKCVDAQSRAVSILAASFALEASNDSMFAQVLKQGGRGKAVRDLDTSVVDQRVRTLHGPYKPRSRQIYGPPRGP
eukprot:3073251-Pyramimonas_sp.AAC.5